MALFYSNLRYKMKIAGDFISSATSINSTLLEYIFLWSNRITHYRFGFCLIYYI
ncbi:hypothetical protein IMSAGC014_00106 [Bacteroidaceae bacterium]|nr:hypothetical protein IMSAGC014_00106 [Bacteroidaceae bacterium]